MGNKKIKLPDTGYVGDDIGLPEPVAEKPVDEGFTTASIKRPPKKETSLASVIIKKTKKKMKAKKRSK